MSQFGLLSGDKLVIVDSDSGAVSKRDAGMVTSGMQRGLTSDDGAWSLLIGYPRAAGDSFTLTVGTHVRTELLPGLRQASAVTVDGTALGAFRVSEDNEDTLCIYSFSLSSDLNHDCIQLTEGKKTSIPVFSTHAGEPELFLLWFTEDNAGWNVYRHGGDGWKQVNEQEGWDYDRQKHGYIARWFSRNSRIYMISTEPGYLAFDFPTEKTTDPKLQYTTLTDLVSGPQVSMTMVGGILSSVFYGGEDVGAGQYVAAVNLADPTKRVGPWTIPPELMQGTGFSSYQTVDSLFFTDQATKEKLGATRQ
ncbi:hypothetical protein [Corynebacterium glucuronolyticum]|uniref:Uncharacterized protein n=2 Tax=Corynebacterium glucuronolyticum TaxID=39791 RepID=A0AAX1L9U4_9CORY|nr:hypothetical protein [Corynebacterium glucuronolyticum]EEI63558.1 hypothetical protein HMPREF0293_0937 [Corynebacterium glucuronolyticum ATCC 51866]QRP70985.1 hypothetical protein I6J21_02155 [Corynebacterium glucuronolyticum]